MKNYLFPKFFNSMSNEELAEYCVAAGIDGPTLLIRDGYAVTEENMFDTLPGFVRTCEAYGAEVKYADTPFDMYRLGDLEEELSLMSENGIELFRVNYIAKSAHKARELHDVLCSQMEMAERAARRHGMKAVVQIHGWMYPHNATAAYFACRNFDPSYLGIKVDPGNNIAQEGHEIWPYQVELLGEYIAAIGEKDAQIARTGDRNSAQKGWVRAFVPATEGINDYDAVFAELKKADLSVPGILMPFYHENDFEALKTAFAEEIVYFKKCQEKYGL